MPTVRSAAIYSPSLTRLEVTGSGARISGGSPDATTRRLISLRKLIIIRRSPKP